MAIEFSEETLQASELIGDKEHSSYTRYLDTVGDRSGTKDIATTADRYFIQPAVGEIFLVDEIRIVIGDTGLFSGGGFGAGAVLGTGCLLQIERLRSGVLTIVQDLLDAVPITMNQQFYSIGKVDAIVNAAGSMISTRIGCRPIQLNGNHGDILVFESQVTLAGLDYGTVSVDITECVRSA